MPTTIKGKLNIVFVLLAVLVLFGGLFYGPSHSEVAVVAAPDSAGIVSGEKTVLFAGDIMLGRLVAKRIQEAQDPLLPFLWIADVIQKADLAFANLEGPISDRGVDQGSKYSFEFEPVGSVNALKFAGFDVLSVANNHIWDWGADALSDTVNLLNHAGIAPVGAGNNESEANTPVIFNLNGTRVAFLAYTNLYPKSLEATADRPGISHFDITGVSSRIAEIKSSGAADIVVVSFHGGIEYEPLASDAQREVAHALVDAGADLFIGTHPHVVEEVEHYHNGYIAYSLGNFVFDQNFSTSTMTGLMVKATIKDKKVERLEQIPVQLTPTFQPYIVGQPEGPML